MKFSNMSRQNVEWQTPTLASYVRCGHLSPIMCTTKVPASCALLHVARHMQNLSLLLLTTFYLIVLTTLYNLFSCTVLYKHINYTATLRCHKHSVSRSLQLNAATMVLTPHCSKPKELTASCVLSDATAHRPKHGLMIFKEQSLHRNCSLFCCAYLLKKAGIALP